MGVDNFDGCYKSRGGRDKTCQGGGLGDAEQALLAWGGAAAKTALGAGFRGKVLLGDGLWASLPKMRRQLRRRLFWGDSGYS